MHGEPVQFTIIIDVQQQTQNVGRRSEPTFVVIRELDKTRRKGVQAQQVTIDDPANVAFLAWPLGEIFYGDVILYNFQHDSPHLDSGLS